MSYDTPWGTITLHRGRYRLRGRLDGELRSWGVYDTLEEARDVALALRDRLSQRAPLTVRGWVEAWLTERDRRGDVSGVDREWSRWRARISRAPWVEVPLRSLTPRQIRRWLYALDEVTSERTGERLSRTYVLHCLRLLSSALTGAVEAGHLASNPALGIRLRRRPALDEAWTWLTAAEVEDVTRVLDDAVGRGLRRAEVPRAVLLTAIYTGLRAGELAGLRWCDVRLRGDRPELHVRRSRGRAPKSGKARRVPLLPQAIDALDRWQGVSPGVGAALVWPARAPAGCHVSGWDAGWSKTWRRRAGIVREDPRPTLHSLRHTCATHLLAGTWGPRLSLHEVRDWLGHASITTTERYSHAVPGALHAAVARAAEEG